jgi:hypothetical protein
VTTGWAGTFAPVGTIIRRNVRAETDPWIAWYRVERHDGWPVEVECEANRTQESVIEATGDAYSREFVADKGEAAAIREAEKLNLDSSRAHGVFIRITLDHKGGTLHVQVAPESARSLIPGYPLATPGESSAPQI